MAAILCRSQCQQHYAISRNVSFSSRWVLWSLMISNTFLLIRDHSGYGFGQWEEALHSNASSHWWDHTQIDPCWLVDITENSRRDILIHPLMMTSRHVNAFRTTGPLWWIPPVPLGLRRHDAHVTSKCCETRELIRCRLGRHSSASEVALI